MDLLERYLREVREHRELGPEVVHQEDIPARRATFGEWPAGVSPEIRSGLRSLGVSELYTHQSEAIGRALAGEDVVVVTPTASGKTHCYNVPVIQTCASDPEARALYLFPIKALEQDQVGAFRELTGACGLADRVEAEIYDGDTPAHQRTRVRNRPPAVVISNPDMLHLSMLGFHAKWEKFLSTLRFVVLDEVHTYRGVFGSHVAHVLRRLLRTAALYGARPQIIASSATIANPGELASGLFGREIGVVADSGAPEAGRHFLFINPQRLSSSTTASRLLRQAIKNNLATIVFTKARKTTELIYSWTIQAEPKLAKLISAYRSGYLAEERREIERQLFSGQMKGVISTSALEMGIDIGALDVCLLVGYPGAITTTWQRGGRVGRQDRASLIVLIAGQDALDQYFMKHPRAFFDSGFEPAIIDPANLPILKDHVVCAAAESPLYPGDPWFSGPAVDAAIAELEQEGRLLRSVDAQCWHASARQPQRGVNIRGIGESHTIFEQPAVPLPPNKKPRVIGSIDGNRVYSEGHPGAIYLHRARQYQVTALDLARKNLMAQPVNVNYYTVPRKEKETEILATRKSKPVRNFITRLGELKVTERVIGYEKRAMYTAERLSVHELKLPSSTFETVGLWIEIDDFIPRAVGRRGLNFMGGIHAVEHAAIALFPLFALCERSDVGGISTPLHPEVGKGAIFIYDGYPGGVGLAEQAFARIEELLGSALALISECPCEKGCPACIYSNKCGSGNVPLDKEAAKMVLAMLLDRPEAQAWKTLGEAAGPDDEEAWTEEAEDRPEERDRSPRVMVLDVETRRGADEVGGWNNIHLMGLAVAVVWDSKTKAMKSYTEDQVDELFKDLARADLVVGFNVVRFDYTVLSAYNPQALARVPTFDILVDVARRLGHRLSLAQLAEQTLGAQKSADGLQSLQWVKEGRMDLVDEYCQKDVAITRDLFYHGLEHHFVRFQDRQGRRLELALDWDLDAIVEKAKKKD